MPRPNKRIRVLLGATVLLLVAGVGWALVSGVVVDSPERVGANTGDQIQVIVKNGDAVVPDAKILVTTDYGWLQPGEVYPDKAKIGELKLLEDQPAQGNKVKRAVYTSNDEGRVFFMFYGDAADIGKEATVIIRELDGTFQTSFRIKIGANQLVQGDPLPVCTPVILEKVPRAGGDPTNHPIYAFCIGFLDSAGNLIDVDDANADTSYTCLTPEATLLSDGEMLFDKYTIIALENVPESGASVYVELIGDNGVAAAGTVSTSDPVDQKWSDDSLWRD